MALFECGVNFTSLMNSTQRNSVKKTNVLRFLEAIKQIKMNDRKIETNK